jgi:ferredoxin
MKFQLDLNTCRDAGECVYASEQIFSLDSNGKQSFRMLSEDIYISSEISPDFEESVRDASIVCPMQAIRII